MNNTQQILDKILKARENRALSRQKLTNSSSNTLSLSLNIAGYPKTNRLIAAFFNQVKSELINYLTANRINIDLKNAILQSDEAGDFFLVILKNENQSLKKIKKYTEKFEEKHKLGRLIDIDIFDKNALPVSSGKEKKCYFCNAHSAVYCMRNKRHTYSEIREKFTVEIQNYLKSVKKEEITKKLNTLALKAILYEVSLSPKPGLVDYFNSGTHSDMNYYSFLNSSAALSPFFREFIKLGYNYSASYKKALPKIREIGLKAEKAMFENTQGVNTQKGLIFIFGIALFATAKILSENKTFSNEKFIKTVKKITKNIVKKELEKSPQNKTNGEKVFVKYHETGGGIRYEAQSGFSTVFKSAIPYFKENLKPKTFKNQELLNKILQTGLLKIMAINNDSNVLHRSNKATLEMLKEKAYTAQKNENEYQALADFCTKNKISPGGSADLLALSLFIHFIEHEITNNQ